ncbi:(2Fe-2S)-binding protein [Desulfotomaculum copahuensis]|uniref:(2Fe-2S)-binding protein n=1 Tax=Desulfotomaculum copahuensis TaxID=1838280 RepID=A0A1B7LGM7_9FIRM|nr:(2Fe-2S)-binding protein [Desulfotomaculum copahuensis]OAT85255.1 (2Fe-2S)-binding protein [Desulfotomaculum copahuensis]
MQAIADKDGVKRYLVTLHINGDSYTRVVKANTLLVNFLRDDLDLTGTKKGCELGDCGSCTVLLDGKAVDSCLILAVEADGREITTIEGLARNEKLDRLQAEMINHAGVQCGYCTPGMIMSAKALLTRNPHPTEREVRQAIAGNLCRCTGYVNIVKAILAAANEEVGEGSGDE